MKQNKVDDITDILPVKKTSLFPWFPTSQLSVHNLLSKSLAAMAWIDDLIWRLHKLRCPKENYMFVNWPYIMHEKKHVELEPTNQSSEGLHVWHLLHWLRSSIGYIFFDLAQLLAHLSTWLKEFAYLILLITWMDFDLRQALHFGVVVSKKKSS